MIVKLTIILIMKKNAKYENDKVSNKVINVIYKILCYM